MITSVHTYAWAYACRPMHEHTIRTTCIEGTLKACIACSMHENMVGRWIQVFKGHHFYILHEKVIKSPHSFIPASQRIRFGPHLKFERDLTYWRRAWVQGHRQQQALGSAFHLKRWTYRAIAKLQNAAYGRQSCCFNSLANWPGNKRKWRTICLPRLL